MWTVLRHRCPSCTVIAGDFGGNVGQDAAYFSEYKKYLRDISGGHQVDHPAVWGIHPYSDTETAEREIQSSGRVTRLLSSTLVAHFAEWLAADKYGSNTRIWLDEISSFTDSSFSLETQREGGQYLFDRLPDAPKAGQPRVTRIYYMRFAGNTADSLINGTPRPIYTAVQNGPRRHALAQDAAPSSTPAAAKPKAAAGSAAPSHAPAATPKSAAAAPGSPAASARFEIRNRADNLCLDANDLGSTAGQNGDVVQLWNCYGATNQEWIPQYKAGQLAWLVSAKYPGMCLNANNVGGLANGRRVQLWNCYMASNELWNVGTMMASPAGSPLFLGTGGGPSLALDADKYSLGSGDKVQIWAYYAGSSQLWAPVPA